MLAAILSSALHHAKTRPAFDVVYSKKRHCIIFEQVIGYDDRPEIHRVRTPWGVATVSVEVDVFPSYRNVDTGPQGLALSVQTPKNVAFELRFYEKGLDVLKVDGRRIKLPRKPPHHYACKLAGGDHFIEVAWPPTE